MAKKIRRQHKRFAPVPDGFTQHQRVTREGAQMGELNHRLYVIGEQIMETIGEPQKDCCNSCAFLRGTVPNGCTKTQLDAFKAVIEGKPFLCHMQHDPKIEVCRGWFAAVQARRRLKADGFKFLPDTVDYEFSPPDRDEGC